MDNLQNLAKETGVPIPAAAQKLPSNYSPIPDPYVVFSSVGYPHCPQVIELLGPVLQNYGIRLVQVGDPSEPQMQGCINKTGISLSEVQFLIDNSLLYFSHNCGFTYLASISKTPCITLLPPSVDSTSIPHYSVNTTPVWPSNGAETVMPEVLVNLALEILGLKERTNLKSVYIAPKYHQRQFSWMMDSEIRFDKYQEIPLVARMDINHNENLLFELIKHRKKPILVIASQTLSKEFLSAAKKGIETVIQWIDENYDKSGLEILKRSGVNYTLAYNGPEEKLGQVKFDLFDFNPIQKQVVKKIENVTEETYFRTKQAFGGRNKLYASLWHFNQDIPIAPNQKVGKALYEDDFWQSLESLFFYELIK